MRFALSLTLSLLNLFLVTTSLCAEAPLPKQTPKNEARSPSKFFPTFIVKCREAEQKDFFSTLDAITTEAKDNKLPAGLILSYETPDKIRVQMSVDSEGKTELKTKSEAAAEWIAADNREPQVSAEMYLKALVELSKASAAMRVGDQMLSPLHPVEAVGVSSGSQESFRGEFQFSKAFEKNAYRGFTLKLENSTLDLGNSLLAALKTSQNLYSEKRRENNFLMDQNKNLQTIDKSQISPRLELMDAVIKGLSDPLARPPLELDSLIEKSRRERESPSTQPANFLGQ